jgi:hypothetical protein
MLTVSVPTSATNSWNNYHWHRSAAQIAPPVKVSGTAAWRSYVQASVADWNQSTVIQSPGPTQVARDPKRCAAIAGEILVCNAAYGKRGWLGIASIWLSNGHISQGTTKLNDSYYTAGSYYDTPAWRAAVTCQEIGHDYGLGHQDEDFNTDLTNSCMDYTSDPRGNEQPAAHDYAMLESIYAHPDATNFGVATLGQSSSSPAGKLNGAIPGDSLAEWGRAVHRDAQGRPDIFVQDLGNGAKKITHVLWAIGEGPRNHHD